MPDEVPEGSGGSPAEAREAIKIELRKDAEFMAAVKELAKGSPGSVTAGITEVSAKARKGLAQAAKSPARKRTPAAPPTATVSLAQQLNDRSSDNVDVSLEIGGVPITVTVSAAKLMTEMSAQELDIGGLFNKLVKRRNRGATGNALVVNIMSAPQVTLKLIVNTRLNKVRWEVKGSIPDATITTSNQAMVTKILAQNNVNVEFYCFDAKHQATFLDDLSKGPSVASLVRIAAALHKVTPGSVTEGSTVGGEPLLIVHGREQADKDAAFSVLKADKGVLKATGGKYHRIVDPLGTVLGSTGHEWVVM